VSEVLETIVGDVQATSPMVIVYEEEVNPVPMMVTLVPPKVFPLEGEMEARVNVAEAPLLLTLVRIGGEQADTITANTAVAMKLNLNTIKRTTPSDSIWDTIII
jgi:hypothetical protein